MLLNVEWLSYLIKYGQSVNLKKSAYRMSFWFMRRNADFYVKKYIIIQFHY